MLSRHNARRLTARSIVWKRPANVSEEARLSHRGPVMKVTPFAQVRIKRFRAYRQTGRVRVRLRPAFIYENAPKERSIQGERRDERIQAPHQWKARRWREILAGPQSGDGGDRGRLPARFRDAAQRGGLRCKSCLPVLERDADYRAQEGS